MLISSVTEFSTRSGPPTLTIPINSRLIFLRPLHLLHPVLDLLLRHLPSIRLHSLAGMTPFVCVFDCHWIELAAYPFYNF